jgi:NitT/TauT family transport system permease protein
MQAQTAQEPQEEIAAIERAAKDAFRRRWRLVYALRIGLLVATLGGWELAGRLKWIDPFFFSMPSEIANQIWVWSTEGTAQGPLWQQVLVTLEETTLGFLIGSIM